MPLFVTRLDLSYLVSLKLPTCNSYNGILKTFLENEYKSGIQFWKKVALSKQYQTNGSKAKMFGLLPSRKKEIGTYVKDDQKGHLIVWLTSFTKVQDSKISEI